MLSCLDTNVKSLPAQHGVGLSCEDGGIHHESGVVHDERHPLSHSLPTAVGLFAAEVIHVDHVARPLAQNLGVVVPSERTQRTRYVPPDQSSSDVGVRE